MNVSFGVGAGIPLDPEYDWLHVHCYGTRLKL